MKYELKEIVKILVSGVNGEIIGRSEYSYAEPLYLLRYKAIDGCVIESWWTESSVESVIRQVECAEVPQNKLMVDKSLVAKWLASTMPEIRDLFVKEFDV
jgi:hypothetical protein